MEAENPKICVISWIYFKITNYPNIQYLLETHLIILQVRIIEHHHAPNRAIVRFQVRTGRGFGHVAGRGVGLIAAEDSQVADGAVDDVLLGDGELVAWIRWKVQSLEVPLGKYNLSRRVTLRVL
jgi:hypothetical protein